MHKMWMQMAGDVAREVSQGPYDKGPHVPHQGVRSLSLCRQWGNTGTIWGE